MRPRELSGCRIDVFAASLFALLLWISTAAGQQSGQAGLQPPRFDAAQAAALHAQQNSVQPRSQDLAPQNHSAQQPYATAVSQPASRPRAATEPQFAAPPIDRGTAATASAATSALESQRAQVWSRPAEPQSASQVQPASFATAAPLPQPFGAPDVTASSQSGAETASSHRSIPLPPPSTPDTTSRGGRSIWQSALSTIFALLLVVGVFGGLALAVGRGRRLQRGSLPPQVFEVLGRSTCLPRQQVLVVRFGPKLLLVSHEPGNVQTLSEIDSPAEVDRLAGLCEQQSAGSVTANFQHVLQSVVQGRTADRPAKRWFAASVSGTES